MINTTKKLNILLLMGGISPEREVSLESGKVCLRAIKDLGHRVQTLDPVSYTHLTLPTNREV